MISWADVQQIMMMRSYFLCFGVKNRQVEGDSGKTRKPNRPKRVVKMPSIWKKKEKEKRRFSLSRGRVESNVNERTMKIQAHPGIPRTPSSCINQ